MGLLEMCSTMRGGEGVWCCAVAILPSAAF